MISSCLPLNSNLAMAQAAHTPKTRLAGTAIAAAVKVSRKAARASGSASAAQNTSMPLLSACVSTSTSGNTSETPRNATAPAINASLIHAGSLSAAEIRALIALAPRVCSTPATG